MMLRRSMERDSSIAQVEKQRRLRQAEEAEAGAYTRSLFSSTKPFWSHLSVSPCLKHWREIMHPMYPTKCAYVEPKSRRV
jgi:hypothetical protein